MTELNLDLHDYCDGPVIDRVPLDAAFKRVRAYCTDPRSGWATYDLAARAARQAGLLDVVWPWSLLYANGLAGRVTLDDVAGFTRTCREEFAHLVEAVPADRDLADIDEALGAVGALCTFSFHGVAAAKATKLAALYRPLAIPVLDSRIALALGFKGNAFSSAGRGPERIRRAVEGLAGAIAGHAEFLGELRKRLRSEIQGLKETSDVRLLDIVLWTSQEDRRKGAYWLTAPKKERLDPADFHAVPVRADA